MRRVYLDSCFVIYLLEETPRFSAEARRFFARHAADAQICVSPLVRLEVLLHPLRDGNQSLQRDYEDFLATLQWLSITDGIFDHALRLRAQYRLKTHDALHLAIAQHYACGELWTNDNRLNEAAGSLAVNVFAEKG